MIRWLNRSISQWAYESRYLRHWTSSCRMQGEDEKRPLPLLTSSRACGVVEKMKIALAADHVGFALKEKVREYLKSKGLEVEDYGTVEHRARGLS